MAGILYMPDTKRACKCSFHFVFVGAGCHCGCLDRSSGRWVVQGEATEQQWQARVQKARNEHHRCSFRVSDVRVVLFGAGFAQTGGRRMAQVNGGHRGMAAASAEAESTKRAPVMLVSSVRHPHCAVWRWDCPDGHAGSIGRWQAQELQRAAHVSGNGRHKRVGEVGTSSCTARIVRSRTIASS
jgi:hypothetical protein